MLAIMRNILEFLLYMIGILFGSGVCIVLIYVIIKVLKDDLDNL